MTSCTTVLDAKAALLIEDSFERHKEARELACHIGQFRGFSFPPDLDSFTESQRKIVRNFEPFVEGYHLTAGLYSYWKVGSGRAPHMVLLAKKNEKITGILVVDKAAENGQAVKVDHFAIARFSDIEDTVRLLVRKTMDSFPKGVFIAGKRARICELRAILGYGLLNRGILSISKEMFPYQEPIWHPKEMECGDGSDSGFSSISPVSSLRHGPFSPVSRATTVYTPWDRPESSLMSEDDDRDEYVRTPLPNPDVSKKVVDFATRFAFRPIRY